jgi:hypothetical protein
VAPLNEKQTSADVCNEMDNFFRGSSKTTETDSFTGFMDYIEIVSAGFVRNLVHAAAFTCFNGIYRYVPAISVGTAMFCLVWFGSALSVFAEK